MKSPLSDRAVADRIHLVYGVRKSHTAIGRWRRGDLRLSADVEAMVLQVIRDEQARVHRIERAQRLGETVIACRVAAADGV